MSKDIAGVKFHVWLIKKGNPEKSLSENMNDYLDYQFKLPDNKVIKPTKKHRTYNHFMNNKLFKNE